MPATPSTMLPLGTKVPSFVLPDSDGRPVSSDQVHGPNGLVVAFICAHCPFVRHIRSEFARFAREYQARGLGVVAVMSNDVGVFPQDGPAGMKQEAQEVGYTFPYLFDEQQEVAKAFRAACTPDLYLFDASGVLVYRGQFDDSRPSTTVPVTGADLRAAADALLAGGELPSTQKASIGCNIKWRAGAEPDYAR
jgi:peroxiredoxin